MSLIDDFRNGKRYGTDWKAPTVQHMNNLVETVSNDDLMVNSLASTPDNTEAGNVGTPEVEIIGSGTSKKFKFKNLRGEQGPQGPKGERGSDGAGVTVNHETVNVNFTSDPQTQLDKTLKIPEKAPTDHFEIVAVDTSNKQVMRKLGDGFGVTDGDTIIVSGRAKYDLSNVTYPQVIANGVAQTGAGDRIIESYISSDGNTWYRKWASGWKECGSKITLSNGTLNYQIIYPLAFNKIPTVMTRRNETNAYAQAGSTQQEIDVVARTASINRVSETGFYYSVISASIPYTYYACGY